MARLARLVVPGVPHHITQRGNRRQIVFFSDSDKSLYLKILSETKAGSRFSILAYCLMNNHLHLIAIPATKDDFAEILGETHRKYTTLINMRESWKGHLWQGRFGSCPMEEPHLYNAAKYVERNPVRAGLVEKAEQFAWSSARGHLGLWTDPLLDRDCGAFLDFGNWRSYLAGKDDEKFVDGLKRHERTGRPFGQADFLARIEALTGRKIKKNKPGRKAGLTVRLMGDECT
jgi:putative transposase